MLYERNIVSFDIETTGLDKSKDFIIQLAAIKFNVENGKVIVIDKFNEYIQPTGSYSISIQAYLKHGIKPEFLKDKPTFEIVSDKFIDFIKDCDLLTYNGTSFDIPFTEYHLNKINKSLNIFERKCYDAFREEKRRNGLTLEETYVRYVGKTMEEDKLTAHNAYSDVAATIKVFNGQQEINEYGPENIISIDGFVETKKFQGKMTPCFSSGKYRDISVEFVKSIDPSYITWINENQTFSAKLKTFINSI